MAGNSVERSTAAYDNLYVRTLAGREAFSRPAGGVTRAHLEAAKARLATYSVVLILDAYDSQAVQLADRIGWRTTSLGHEAPNQGVSFNMSSFFSAAQLAILRAANALDYELYCFAQRLALARTRESAARQEQWSIEY